MIRPTPTDRAVIDVGRKCNIKSCAFCYYKHLGDLTKQEMQPAFKLIHDINEAKKRGNNYVDFTGGEPTIHPDIVHLVKYALNEHDMGSCIITNCLAGEKRTKELIDAGVDDWLVSLHGTEAYHDEVTGIVGSRKKQERFLSQISEAMSFRVNCVINQRNQTDLADIAKYCVEWKARIVNFINMNPHGDWTSHIDDFNAIRADLRVAEPHLNEAIKILEGEGIGVNVRYYPMCRIAPEYRRCVCNDLHVMFDPYEWDYDKTPKTVERYHAFGVDMNRRIEWRQEPCCNCQIQNACGGINKGYQIATNKSMTDAITDMTELHFYGYRQHNTLTLQSRNYCVIKRKPKPTIALNMISGPGDAVVLERCLKSAQALNFDEVVICLTSDDEKTEAVAKKYATKVVKDIQDPIEDFSRARNKALENTSTDWFMWLDSDDIIPDKATTSFRSVMDRKLNEEFNIIRFPYLTTLTKDGRPTNVIMKERLFKRNGKRWINPVHEAIPISSVDKILTVKGDARIAHLPMKPVSIDRNLRILKKQYAENYSGRTAFYLGHELMNKGDRVTAIQILEKLLFKRDVNNDYLAMACLDLARMFLYRDNGTRKIHFENIGKAETYAKIGISMSNAYAEFYVVLGDIYEARGMSSAAIQYFEKAMQIPFGHGAYSQSRMYYSAIPAHRLSEIFFRKCEFERALHYASVAYRCADSRLVKRYERDRQIIFDQVKKDFES